MQQYNTVSSRNLIQAERTMLKHADPIKVISMFGQNKEVPQRKTDTVVFRRPLPIDYGANGAPDVTASNYLLQEGVTPSSRTIQYQDVQATLQQYGVLMKLSSKAEMLYEDDIPGDMTMLVGEHMGSIEEMISYGVLRGGTNVVYANGSARNAVTATVSLGKLRQVSRVIESAHGKKVTQRLSSGTSFGMTSVDPGYLAFVHTDLVSDIEDLPGFKSLSDYGSQKPVHPREFGSVGEHRFVSSPYFKPFLQAGANAAAGTVLSNGVACTGSNATDVYPIMIVAQDAWGQVALKGASAIDPIYLPARQKTHANPAGQFGYVGANFWKTAVRLNENWIVRLEVGASAL